MGPYSEYTLLERNRLLEGRIEELERMIKAFIHCVKRGRQWQWEDGYDDLYDVYEKACHLLGVKPEEDEREIIEPADVRVHNVNEEYEWLNCAYPGWTLIEEQRTVEDGVPFDVVSIRTAAKEEYDIYFNISAFYGNR